MNNQGKAVLAALGNGNQKKPNIVPVMPGRIAGEGYRYGFQAQNPVWSTLAKELTQWANGDLSFLEGRMPVTGTMDRGGDKDKRKRDALADVLDGKSK